MVLLCRQRSRVAVVRRAACNSPTHLADKTPRGALAILPLIPWVFPYPGSPAASAMRRAMRTRRVSASMASLMA